MKINRFVSVLSGLGMSTMGLGAGLAVSWPLGLVLSIFGLGPLLYLLMGIFGISAGFIAYVKLCKYMNCWPMYAPPPSYLQSTINLFQSNNQNGLYEELKVAINALEPELNDVYQKGWKNFNLEFSNEMGPLWEQVREKCNLQNEQSSQASAASMLEGVTKSWLKKNS